MKRDRTKKLKANAKLDVRLPDQLKEEFLARCREEGVSSGAVIRSLIVGYVPDRRRGSPVRLASLKVMMMRRVRWIIGLIAGGTAAATGTLALVFAPSASAEDLRLDYFLEVGKFTVAQGRLLAPFDQPVTSPTTGDENPHHFSVTARPCAPDAQAPCSPDRLILEMVIYREGPQGREIVSTPTLIVHPDNMAAIGIGQQDNRDVTLVLFPVLTRSAD